MRLTSEQNFILFSLGKCYEEFNRRFKEAPVQIEMSKSHFIELARAAGMVQKKARALYKNLEDLEAKKLLSYANTSLKLTYKGEKHYQRLLAKVEPYVAVSLLLKLENVLKYTKMQARFR